ncbi:hypothetical protein BH18ACI2_BH18ACI2_01550 [soil metagenome]
MNSDGKSRFTLAVGPLATFCRPSQGTEKRPIKYARTGADVKSYRLIIAIFAARRSLNSGSASKTSRARRTLLKGAETWTP